MEPDRDRTMAWAFTPGFIRGRCSACGLAAQKSPSSGHWWHVAAPACQNTNPVRAYPPSVYPEYGAARFVADEPADEVIR